MVRAYRRINYRQREELYLLVKQRGLKVKQAARLVGINYENAKAIYRSLKKLEPMD